MKTDNRIPEQIEQIPGQMTVAEVLNPEHATEQVRAEEVRKDSPLTDSHGPATGADQVPDNITPITHARNKRTRAKSAQTGADGQSGQEGAEREIDPVEGQTEVLGADESGMTTLKRVRGKDKVPRKKRYGGSLTANIPPDDKQLIVHHNVEVWSLGKLKDRNDEEEVRERIATYFSICEKNQQMPTIAGLALSLGIDRSTLWLWIDNKTGVIKNPAVLDTLKGVYNLIASQYEGMLTQGKIVPVSGFFLLQNNFGYKNQTDHVVVAQPAEEPDTGEIAARAGLLDSDD